MKIKTPLTVDEAFTYMSDVTRYGEWDSTIKSAVLVRGDGRSVGSAYDLTIKTFTTTEMRYEVMKYDAPHFLELLGQSKFLRSVDEIRVQASDAGALVIYSAHLTLKGPLAIFDKALQLGFNRLGENAAKGLVRVLRGTRV